MKRQFAHVAESQVRTIANSVNKSACEAIDATTNSTQSQPPPRGILGAASLFRNSQRFQSEFSTAHFRPKATPPTPADATDYSSILRWEAKCIQCPNGDMRDGVHSRSLTQSSMLPREIAAVICYHRTVQACWMARISENLTPALDLPRCVQKPPKPRHGKDSRDMK